MYQYLATVLHQRLQEVGFVPLYLVQMRGRIIADTAGYQSNSRKYATRLSNRLGACDDNDFNQTLMIF
jgi:hypothetical protein